MMRKHKERLWHEAREGRGGMPLMDVLASFALGLGIVELVTPGVVSRLLGLRDHRRTRLALAACGVREIAHGVSLLTQPGRPHRRWARVLGDVLDLAMLAWTWRRKRARGEPCARIALATTAAAGVTALDVVAATRGPRLPVDTRRTFTRFITINRPPDDVYAFWRDLENLPRFMAHLESVHVLDADRSRWRARGPLGKPIHWHAILVDDEPGKRIAWRSLPDAEVPNQGTVTFRPAPGNRGTEVRVDVQYTPPAGRLGTLVAMLAGEEPGQQIEGDLRRLKQVLEAGEVVHSDASIHRGRHPAQPSLDEAV